MLTNIILWFQGSVNPSYMVSAHLDIPPGMCSNSTQITMWPKWKLSRYIMMLFMIIYRILVYYLWQAYLLDNFKIKFNLKIWFFLKNLDCWCCSFIIVIETIHNINLSFNNSKFIAYLNRALVAKGNKFKLMICATNVDSHCTFIWMLTY